MNHFVHLTEKKQTQTRVNVSVCLMCRDPLERGNNRKKNPHAIKSERTMQWKYKKETLTHTHNIRNKTKI